MEPKAKAVFVIIGAAFVTTGAILKTGIEAFAKEAEVTAVFPMSIPFVAAADVFAAIIAAEVNIFEWEIGKLAEK